MHRSDLLTILDFLANLFTFTLNRTGIRFLCLHSQFPTKMIVCKIFTLHMVEPWLEPNLCGQMCCPYFVVFWSSLGNWIFVFRHRLNVQISAMYLIKKKKKKTFGSGSDWMRKKSYILRTSVK